MEDILELTTLMVTFDLFNVSFSNMSASSYLANSSNTSHKYIRFSPYYQHSLMVAVGFTLAYLFIFLLCMVGNVLVCLTVIRNHHMRTVTNLFILNLAISDLLVGIFCIPTTLVDNIITGWPFSNAVCKLSGLVQGISVCASVFTLVAIAVHRFRSIVYPVKPKITVFAARATIWLIWALALVIMLPSAVMLTVEQEMGHFMVHSNNQTVPLYYCYETWPDPEMRKVYTMVLFTHIYLVPLTLIIIMYGCICVKLYSATIFSNSNTDTSGAVVVRASKHTISQRKVKVVKMLIVVALLFMLSWLPLWTVLIITDYARPEGDQLDLLTSYIYPFSHWLAFSNSSVNPIIYGYFNENFKRGFHAACSVASCCRVDVEDSRVRQTQPDAVARTPRNTALSANPLARPGARNRISDGNDPTGCVCLEMEQRKAEAVVQAGGSFRVDGEVPVKRSYHVEDGDRATGGSFLCQAWEV